MPVFVPPDYDYILNSINEGKCVLFLGPEVCRSVDGNHSYVSLLAERLMKDNFAQKYYPADRLFHFESDMLKTKAHYPIQTLFAIDETWQNVPFQLEFYQKVVRLPFHLIVSASPDLFLYKYFQHLNLPHTFDFFHKSKSIDLLEKPANEKPGNEKLSKDKPLIFNLVGSTDELESLILTHQDMFVYLTAVLGPNKLPNLLSRSLQKENIKQAIFLGFSWNKWSSHLLLRLLGLGDPAKGFPAYIPEENLNKTLLEFCQTHFRVDFVDDNYHNFLDGLLERAEQWENDPSKKFKLRKFENSKDATFINQEIFISYAWGGNREDIVNQLYDSLTAKGYKVVRDKINLGYRGKIKEFMQRIGVGKAVIVVLSKKYLESPNCMYEALEMSQHPDLQKRIFPVVLEEANLYDPLVQIDYLNVWDAKINDLNQKLKGMINLANSTNLQETLNTYTLIRQFIDSFITIVADMNALTPEMHVQQDFESLAAAIDQKFTDDALAPPAPQS